MGGSLPGRTGGGCDFLDRSGRGCDLPDRRIRSSGGLSLGLSVLEQSGGKREENCEDDRDNKKCAFHFTPETIRGGSSRSP
jgi:hypothetical protein